MGAVITASADPRGTCTTPTSSREIDYFLVNTGLSAGIASIQTVPLSGLRTHKPVKLEFKPRLTSMRALVIRKPPSISTERIVGPLREVAHWEEIARAAKALVARAADETEDADEVHCRLGELYAWWSDLAEDELMECAVGGQAMPKRGLRGRAPVLVWRSVLPERPKNHTDTRTVFWRNVSNLALDLQRMATERAVAASATRGTQRGDDQAGAGGTGIADPILPPADGTNISDVDTLLYRTWSPTH
jgi:hypothetical protein